MEEDVILTITDKLRKLNGAFYDEKIKEIEEEILNLNMPILSYVFAKNIQGADIRKHETIVTKSRDVFLNYIFAKDVEGANIEEHKKIIDATCDWFYVKAFREDVLSKKEKVYHKIEENIDFEKEENDVLTKIRQLKNN